MSTRAQNSPLASREAPGLRNTAPPPRPSTWRKHAPTNRSGVPWCKHMSLMRKTWPPQAWRAHTWDGTKNTAGCVISLFRGHAVPKAQRYEKNPNIHVLPSVSRSEPMRSSQISQAPETTGPCRRTTPPQHDAWSQTPSVQHTRSRHMFKP